MAILISLVRLTSSRWATGKVPTFPCLALASGPSPTPAASPQKQALHNPVLQRPIARWGINPQLQPNVRATRGNPGLSPIGSPFILKMGTSPYGTKVPFGSAHTPKNRHIRAIVRFYQAGRVRFPRYTIPSGHAPDA